MKNLLLLFAAFITITPVFSQVSDSTKTPPDSVWQELPDQRTYFSKTFYNAHDETFRAEISAGYVHFQARDGSYKEINTNLQPVGGNAYEMRDGLYQIRFSGALGQQGGYDIDYELPKPVHAKLKDPGKPPASPSQLRWKILSLGYFDQKTQRYHVFQKSNPIAPVAAGNAISYPQIFNGIDLNYTCGNTRLKEELVLSQSGRDALPDPSQFGVSRTDAYLMLETEFALTPASLEVFAKTSSGRVRIKQGNNFVFTGVDRIDFEDADSTLHFFFPEDVAYTLADSANRINVTRVFSSQRGKDYVLVGVPFSWVDSAPKGTLVIDPTTTASASDDTWLEGTTINGNITQFLIGKAYGFPKKRALLKFNLSGVPTIPAPTIVNAQMKLYYYTSNSGTGGAWVDRWVQAHQVLVNWNEAQATRDNRLTSTPWNVQYVGLNDVDAKSSYESNNLFQTGQTGTWKIWDLTALTHKWVNGTATNNGVVLWATNEATDGYDLRFYSSEYTVDPTKVPKLEIIYSRKARTVYFLKDHLGSIRATVWDTTGAPVVGYDDYDPWGFLLAGRSLANSVLPVATRNRFTGKERDDEFGVNWDYFGARYYDAQIGRWMARDPLAEKYPNWSPYNYVLSNPTRFLDPNGADTITDSTGKVIKVNANGDLGVYRTHTETGGTNELGIPMGPRTVLQKMGETLAWNSFLLNGDPEQGEIGTIDFDSFDARDFILSTVDGIAALNQVSPFQGLIFYMPNADNLGVFDFKTWGGDNPQNIYRGSQLSEGVYLSARDAGKYMAGLAAAISGVPEEMAMRALGSFNLGGNDYVAMVKYFFNNPVGAPNYGELPLSATFQRFGYNRTGLK